VTMPAARVKSPACCFRLFLLAAVLAMNGKAGLAQVGALKDSEQTAVRVNILTEYLGSPESVVEFGGKVAIPDYRPRIIKLFPSTGIVIDGKGHVVTYLGYRWVDIHSRNPRVEIVDFRGKKFPAELIGIDQSVRIAVVLCRDCNLKASSLCRRCEIKDGAFVVAPLLDGSNASRFESAKVLSASARGDSAGGREWTIQVNRPLSLVGAPMLNSQKQVIGLVADEPSRDSSGDARVNVTIMPVEQMLGSADRIIKAGGDIQSGWLGVKVDSDAGSPSGVAVTEVEKESPAHKAGVLPGDIMVKWNGASIQDPLKYIRIVENTPIGSKAVIEVLRQGRPVTLTAIIEARRPQDPEEKLVIDVQDAIALPRSGRASSDAEFVSLLGIEVQSVPPQLAEFLQMPGQTGLLVMSVKKQAAFDRAGVAAGDVILDVDGTRVAVPQSFFDHIKSRGWGSRILLRLWRRGIELSKAVQLPRLPGSSRRPSP